MSKQDEIQQIAEERDAARLELEQAHMELVAFQQAAQEQVEKLKAACPPPESGVSINVAFTATTAGVTITGGQLTLRAENHTQAFDVLATLAGIVQEKHWKFSPAPAPAAPPVENRALVIAREAGAEPAVIAQVKQATEGVPMPPDGKAWEVLDCERWEVKSEAAGKASVLFYEKASHKGPTVKAGGWTMERAAGLLKHVADTAKIFVSAGDVTAVVPTEGGGCRVYYLLGKEYTKTMGPNAGQKDRYKDVYHVRPL